ncbi:GNAT family N-acetyltransferase [Erythrobacter insulae]|uniref:GNAT family N-acetyltransferase n=1 Tax=Erythrobacter insulae TaxID=2584124 RepID=A0A547P8R2_9SPHN|nr:GNAT family N-acetyltransferase [Erythrobacter insulae]TRD10528.1 GNAT family N-acetyltransferase [Erythrobacter insulae]
MFHRSARLLLRPLWPEDWQGVLSGIADEDVVRNLASAPWPYAAEDARRFVSLPIDPLFPRFLITRARDAEIVGCIGMDPMDGDKDAVELGYWIARPYWGQGFATEAGTAALKVARTLGHRRLFASHFLDNPASGAVLRKIGFCPTGRIVERHSCGRGEKSPTAEYELLLESGADEDISRAA